jgi:hypothetical protein
MPEHDVTTEDEKTVASSSEVKPRRTWLLLLAAFSVAGSLALGVLNVVGAGTGPVVNVVVVVMLLAAFLAALSKALEESFAKATRRMRLWYVVGVVACALLLLAAGLATRTVAPLTRMPGTSDVAMVGVLAPSEDLQQEYDDLGDAIAKAMPAIQDGQVRSYTSEVDPPLENLRADDPRVLNDWLTGFLEATDAELVLAGFATAGTAGQTTLHTLAYVPGRTASDAAELSGWYSLDVFLTDRAVDSARIRRAVTERIVSRLRGLTGFLEGLDAWQAGFPADAVAAFGTVVRQGSAEPEGGISDLAHLFRGHARETLAQAAGPEKRGELLREAHGDYTAIPPDSAVSERARLSLATNDYLRAAQSGCTPGNRAVARLRTSSAVLGRLTQARSLPELLRRRAQVNRAQIDLCRLRSGHADASDALATDLEGLTTMRVPANDVQASAYRQVKALALSISAIRQADAGRLEAADQAMAAALELDPRFERQSLWLGLRSAWLLRDCQVAEGSETQQAALAQVRAAAEAGRIPSSDVEAYTHAFARDLAGARKRCGDE